MAKYSNLSDARAAFDRDMASGKASTSDWGSYYHSTAKDSGGSVVTSSPNSYHYSSDGSAYYTDSSGNRTQLSGARGTESYVNGEFASDGNGGHYSKGYDPAYSGLNSASRELTNAEKDYYNQLVQSVIDRKYGTNTELYNQDLRYALQGTNMTPAEYRQDLLNRVGTTRADGSYVTREQVDKELERLGLGANSTYAQDTWYNALNGSGNLANQPGVNMPSGFVNLGLPNGTLNGGTLNGQQQITGTMNTTNPALEYLMKTMQEADAQAAKLQKEREEQQKAAQAAQQAIIEQMMAQQRAAEEARQARINALVGDINAQRPNIENQSDELARQAYINQRLGQQAARENLAASGLSNTGVSETTNLGLQTAYQQALNNINQNKQSALLDLDNAVYQARQTGDADIATLKSNHAQNMANLLTQQEQTLYDRWLNGYQMDASQANTNWSNAMSLQQLGMQMDDAAWQKQYAMYNLGLQQEQQQWEREMAMAQYNNQLRQMQLNASADQTSAENERLYKLLNAGVLTPEVLQYAGLSSPEEYYNMLKQIELAQYIPKTTSKAKTSSSSRNYGFDDSDIGYTTTTLPQTTAPAAGQLYNINYKGDNYQLSADELASLIPRIPAEKLSLLMP